MAPRLRLLRLALASLLVVANVPLFYATAVAAGLDSEGEAMAKEAAGLYRQGLYAEAAKLFTRLVVDYPAMPIFERNLGACFYYLKKPEPALSNLRNYLIHRKDIPADDKAVVDRWIEEMEALRTQNAAGRAVATPGAPTGPAVEQAGQGGPARPGVIPPSTTPMPSPVSASPLPWAAPGAAPAPMQAPLVQSPPASVASPGSPGSTGASAPGLNFAANLAASPASSPEPRRPVYKTWWFWGAAGAVLVAGVVTTVVLLSAKSSSNVPQTELGNQGVF